MVLLPVKNKRPVPPIVSSIKGNLSPYMFGVEKSKRENRKLNVSDEVTTICESLLKSPYGENGRINFVLFGGQSVRDGVYGFSKKDKDSKTVSFMNRYTCSRSKTGNRKVHIRVPVDSDIGEIVPVVQFGEHKHQLFDNSFYDLETGLSIYLVRLYEVMDELKTLGFSQSKLVKEGSSHFFEFEERPEAIDLLSELYDYEQIFEEFHESGHFVKGLKGVSYAYFDPSITSGSSLTEKLFGMIWIGARTTTRQYRIKAVGNNIKDCAKYLNRCGSLSFIGCDLFSGVDKTTAFTLEQVLLANFQAPTNERPEIQLENERLITGHSAQIFSEQSEEAKLSAYLLISRLILSETWTDEWFRVDLTPRMSSSKNALVDFLKVETIKYNAYLMKSGFKEENSIGAILKRGLLISSETDKLNNESKAMKKRICELEARLGGQSQK